MLSGLLTALLIIVALVLIVLVIALQHGNEGGIGSAFGSGNSAGFFGASGGVSLIVRATWICGALFFGLSTALAWVKTNEKFGVGRELENSLLDSSGAAPSIDATSPAVEATMGAEAVNPAPSAPQPAATSQAPAGKPAVLP